MSRQVQVAFVGDVHLGDDPRAVEAFLRFMSALAERTPRIVLMGDLFDLWIGRRELEQPHHRRVVEHLAAMRRSGTYLRYVEGNRDYRIARAYEGLALDEAGDRGFAESVGDGTVFAIHGDLTNPADRQYRRWRRFSRSTAIWSLFNAIPRGWRRRLADDLERRMRTTNREFKSAFPERQVRDYAAGFLEAGHRAVILGHFHVERDLEDERGRGRILVLPEWKESRRHLEAGADGILRFVDSPTGQEADADLSGRSAADPEAVERRRS